MNDIQRLIEQATERCDSINTMCSDQRRATKEVLTKLVANALAVAERADFSSTLCNINDTCRARGFEAGPSGTSTEDRVIALAQAYDALQGRLKKVDEYFEHQDKCDKQESERREVERRIAGVEPSGPF